MNFKCINDKVINLDKVNYFTKWYRSNHTFPYTLGCKFDNGKFEVLKSFSDEIECDNVINTLNEKLTK